MAPPKPRLKLVVTVFGQKDRPQLALAAHALRPPDGWVRVGRPWVLRADEAGTLLRSWPAHLPIEIDERARELLPGNIFAPPSPPPVAKPPAPAKPAAPRSPDFDQFAWLGELEDDAEDWFK
jgi:hypothetical protein